VMADSIFQISHGVTVRAGMAARVAAGRGRNVGTPPPRSFTGRGAAGQDSLPRPCISVKFRVVRGDEGQARH